MLLDDGQERCSPPNDRLETGEMLIGPNRSAHQTHARRPSQHRARPVSMAVGHDHLDHRRRQRQRRPKQREVPEMNRVECAADDGEHAGALHRRAPDRIRTAAQAAPNPLLMLVTTSPGAQLASML